MKAPFSSLPALPAATGVVAGILLFEFTSATACVVAGVAFILVFIYLYLTRRHYASFYFLSAVAGICCAFANSKTDKETAFTLPGIHMIEAKVIENDIHSDKPSLTVELHAVDSIPTSHIRCRIQSIDPATQTQADLYSLIRLRCRLNNIVSANDVPYEYDTYKSMFNDNVEMIAYPVDNDIAISAPPLPLRMINSLRKTVYRAIVNSPVSGDTAAFLLAVILGERHYLDSETIDNYRSLGVAHILALSGLHVGVLALLFSFLLWPVRLLPHNRGLKAVLLMVAVWMYALVCGMGDSIIRATIMLSVLALSGVLQRRYYPSNALLLAITVILAYNPSGLFSPGFQLSVAAVMSIIAFSPVVPDTLRRRPVLFFLANMVALPVTAMLGTGAVSAFHFSTFPSAFLPANIIVGLIFPYILIGGAVIMLLTMLGIDFSFLGHLLDHTLSFMDSTVDAMYRILPPAVVNLHFSAWALVPYAMALVLLAIAVRQRKKAPAIAGLAFSVVALIVIDLSKPAIPDVELYLIRHPATCIMVRSENKAALLATCTDNDTLAIRKLVESRCRRYLQSRGCNTLMNLKDFPSGLNGFALRGNRLYAGKKNIYILDNDTIDINAEARPDYMLVGRGFTGDLARAIDILAPDSIIVASDIHPSRRKRFLREIDDLTRLIDLRDRPFAIVSTK